MKTEQQYKDLTVKEFTKAAQVYETDHAGIYEMCREDYPYIEKELLKEVKRIMQAFMRCAEKIIRISKKNF